MAERIIDITSVNHGGITKSHDQELVTTFTGTKNVDVLQLGDISFGSLSFSKTQNGYLRIKTTVASGNVVYILKEFELSDKIRTNQGDFTLEEIFEYGNNAPLCVFAKLNVPELPDKCKAQVR